MIRVMVLGYGPMGLALTRGVLACEPFVTLVGVFPWSYLPSERNSLQERSEHAFRWFIVQHQLPVVEVSSVNHFQFVSIINTLKPDVVLVGSWGEIFKSHILEIPGVRFLNCHPSLLPQHRGANPYTSALLAGDTETGITFHVIDAGIDTGPIAMQAHFAINPDETGETLRERCARLAEEMIPALLRQIDMGTLTLTPQGQGMYDHLDENTGWIDWTANPTLIDRKFRALYPWFENYAKLGKYTLTFRFGRLLPNLEQAHVQPEIEPGTIVFRKPGAVVATTCDPRWLLQLEKPSFKGFPWLVNPLLQMLYLRPGKRFTQCHALR